VNKLWETYRQKKGIRMESLSVSLLKRLADELGYSLEQTQDYCLEIWKYFKCAPPDLEMILEAYEGVGVNQAPPSWIAYSILVADSQQREAQAGGEKQPSFLPVETKVVRQIEKEIPKNVRINILKSYGLQRSSILDQERVNPDRLERCSHGVPKGQVCCICNEKEFRNMTGIE
jgi:hypothetical protein